MNFPGSHVGAASAQTLSYLTATSLISMIKKRDAENDEED